MPTSLVPRPRTYDLFFHLDGEYDDCNQELMSHSKSGVIISSMQMKKYTMFFN